MLVLSRKAKQRIVIGDNIELVVVAVSGDRVKLGVNAPSDVPIHREEVHRRIQSESHLAEVDRNRSRAAGNEIEGPEARRTECVGRESSDLSTIAALAEAEMRLTALGQRRKVG